MPLIRDCDICKHSLLKSTPAKYDAPTTSGPWAYMCEVHYIMYGQKNYTPTILANVDN